MHLAIDLNVLHHVAAVGLQSAVEVVQVVYAAHTACGGVEELRGDGLREGVALTAVLLVARDHVVAFFLNHTVEGGYFVGRVLQVGVHGDDHVALSALEAAVECGTLAVVAAKLDAVHRVGMLFVQAVDDALAAVRRTVVHKNDFIRESAVLHHARYPVVELFDALVFVPEGYYYTYIHS